MVFLKQILITFQENFRLISHYAPGKWQIDQPESRIDYYKRMLTNNSG